MIRPVKVCLLNLLLFSLLISTVNAQEYTQSQLYSQENARVLLRLCDKIDYDKADLETISQAELMIRTAHNLGSGTVSCLQEYLKAVELIPNQDNSSLVMSMLKTYVNRTSDLKPALNAVEYLLDKQNSRREREGLLVRILDTVGPNNELFASSIASELAILSAEKGDYDAARIFFVKSYQSNPYNSLAFVKLSQIDSNFINVQRYLYYLRNLLVQDRYNLDIAVRYASALYANGLYSYSVPAWAYCATLYEKIYPGQPLSSDIYLPWALAAYNSPKDTRLCINIAETVRNSGINNIILETIAAKAAFKSNDKELGNIIIADAEASYKKLLSNGEKDIAISQMKFAWFYAFAKSDKEKSLYWANQAINTDSENKQVMVFLAFVLTQNELYETAQEVLDLIDTEDNQLALLSKAMIALHDDQPEGLKQLKEVVRMDAGTIEASYALSLIRENGSEFISLVDTTAIEDYLQNYFPNNVVSQYKSISDVINVKFNSNGVEYGYNSDIVASIVVSNVSSDRLYVADGGVFNGNLRVDAVITGDLSEKFENVCLKEVIPGTLVEPGQSLFIPLKFTNLDFINFLERHPQASLEIKLIAYLDPFIQDDKVYSSILDLGPIEYQIRRNDIRVTRKFLMQKLDTLAKGRTGQKLAALKLFAGLYHEQGLLGQKNPPYKYIYTQPELLKSALIRGLSDTDWTTKMYALELLSDIEIDYDLSVALSECINDRNWPVRMLALKILDESNTAGSIQILDWAVKYDPRAEVKEMAQILGGKVK